MKKFFKNHLFILITLVVFASLAGVYSGIVTASVNKFNGFKIVIDAGHGGRDGGSVGVNGTIEKDINLKYAKALKEKFVSMGYYVEMTRKTNDGLYSETAKNKKLSDLNERMKIIKRANPNLMISIHMNSFPSSSAKGAVTYYRLDDVESKKVGDLVQKSLHTYCGARWENAKTGDYYILNKSYYTSILIECGFISNPEEEKLLNSAEYCGKFVSAVCSGVGLYFGHI